jgi:hypothetical protein
MYKPSKASLSWECVVGICILFVLLQLSYFRTLQQKMQTDNFHLSTALKHIGGVEVHIHLFLTMVLDRGVVNFTPRSLFSRMGKLPRLSGSRSHSRLYWRRGKSPTRIRIPDRPARNTDYAKKPGAKYMYQQLQHFTHTVCLCTYNDSHNKYPLFV